MLHRPAVGFSYGSFLLMGLRSSIYGQILSLKNHIQCPFPCKSAWGLVLCHPSIYLIPTTCCSLCTMKRFQPFFFTCSPSALSAGGCLSPARLHLPEGCLPSSPSHIYCWPASQERATICFCPKVWIWGVWSLLGEQFLHILPFLSLKNLLHFCFDFTLCPFTVRQDFSKINWFPWCTLWDMFLLSGVMFFVTCIFIAQRRREKGEDLRLLYFSVVSLLFISTFTSCLSSLYHPNVLRSKLSALPFHVLHSGFAESTAHHIPISLMARESCWGIYEPHQTFFVFLRCFDCLIFLHTRRMCSLHTRRMHTRWEELIDLLRPALINPEKKSNQPIHHHCEFTSSLGGCSFWFLPQTRPQVSFELTTLVYFHCCMCWSLACLSYLMGVDRFSVCYSAILNFVYSSS